MTSYFYLSCLFLTIILESAFCAKANRQLVNLQGCFEYKKNFWLVGFSFHTSSVSFKDDCLRLCLSAVTRGSLCLSAMHVPSDNQCIISNQNQKTRPDMFVENDADHAFTVSYFRNVCADPPEEEGARLEARLTGFKGGQGILELWQKRGKRPQIMIIMTGLEENKNYHAIFVPMDSSNAKSCFRRGLSKEEAEGEKLISIVADHTGMAVMPWTPIDFHVLSDDIVGKQVLIVEEGSQQIVDCGRLEVKGNHSTWLQEISNSTGMSSDFSLIYSLFIASIMTFMLF